MQAKNHLIGPRDPPRQKTSHIKIQTEYEPIIDYPRHIRISSAQPNIREANNMMREQYFFHHKFKPELVNYANRHLFQGFYSPNQEVHKQEEDQVSVIEYIRNNLPENMT